MTATTPLHLTGHLAPVPDEIDAVDLPVEGALPPGLTGRYLRNGPNPLPGEPSAHWFTGHGMVHGVRLRDGRAEWYRNRWVRTKALAGESMIGPNGIDHSVGVANTHVIAHAGKILALVESSFPHVLTPELETLGTCDFDGRLTTAMTAHPKTDPATGELHFFGYGVMPPFLTYHRLSADGELVTSAEIATPGPTMMHDFAITDRHAVFLDLPMTFSFARLADGMPFGWDDAYGARIGVMPLSRPGEVTWFDVDPSYVFHVGNAHTDAAGRVVLDACRYGAADAVRMWSGIGTPASATGVPAQGDPAGPSAVASGGPAAAAAATGAARLHRWVLDPATGAATETPLDDRPVEFPTLDDARVGREARYRYAVSGDATAAGIVKFDAATGAVDEHALGADTVAGEAVFVAADEPGRAEDDGWLLTITTRRDGSGSQLLVLDATDVAGPPVAAVTLPRAVPAGFHGSWIADNAVDNDVPGAEVSDDVRQLDAGSMLRGMGWDVGLPLVGYYALHFAGVGDWPALLTATALAGVRIGWVAIRDRSLNLFASVMLVVFGLGVLLALVSGDTRFLLLKNSIVTGAVGLVFLTTVLVGTPLSLAASQSFQPARREEIRREYDTEPLVRRGHRVSSTVWGAVLLVESLVRVPLVYLLPISVMVGVGEAMSIVAFAGLITWTLWYVRRAGAREAAERASRSAEPE